MNRMHMPHPEAGPQMPPAQPAEQASSQVHPLAEAIQNHRPLHVLGEHVGHIVANLMPTPRPTEAQLADPAVAAGHEAAKRQRRTTAALVGTMALSHVVDKAAHKLPAKYQAPVRIGAKAVGYGASYMLKHQANKPKASTPEQSM